MALRDRKVLFFIAGVSPTAQEQALMDGIVGKVQVRSLLHSSLYGAAAEPCDAVAAAPTSSIPAEYAAKDDVTPAPGGTSLLVANGDSLPVLSDDGTQSALTTGATSAGVTLTAVEAGEAGDEISFEKLTQVPTASAPLVISVSAKKITARLGTSAGAKQKETATVVGAVTSPVAQVETATAAGTVVDAGNASVVVTAAGLLGSPITLAVAVAALDTPTLWAAKVRTALAANAAIAAMFTVGGATTAIVLTKIVKGANDATLNIALSTGTATGITTAATSANTTAGVAGGAGNATVVITSAAITGSPLTVSVPVCEDDTASQVAAKIRAKLNTIEAIVGDGYDETTRKFTVSGSGATVVLERYIVAANDGTLNISIDNGTCTGLTTAATSANTTAGAIVAINTTAAQLATAINAHPEAAGLVTAVAVSGGASVVVAVAETPLAGGADPTVDSAAVAVVQNGVAGTLP